MFDYVKMDNMFEAIQASYYNKSKFPITLISLDEHYTKDWECRIFKKMGAYLKSHGMTIHQAFQSIDEDGSGTVSLEELKNAVVRMNLKLNDKELRMFLAHLVEEGQDFIT